MPAHLPALYQRHRLEASTAPCVVPLDFCKYVHLCLCSQEGGGCPGYVAGKNVKEGQGGAGASDDEEEDENPQGGSPWLELSSFPVS